MVDDTRDAAGALADVARQLQWQRSPLATWQRIVELAVQTVEGCDLAAITLVRNGREVHTVAATGRAARQVDEIQYAVRQGPCLDAIAEHDVFVTDDLLAEGRWPDFSRRAAEETGIRSLMGFWLFVQQDTLGALNLYSRVVGAFPETSRTVGALFASHAALAMSSAGERQHTEQLETALEKSRGIGMAVGLLMASRQVDSRTAFQILAGASQRSNVKVRELADRLVATHERDVSPVGDDPGALSTAR